MNEQNPELPPVETSILPDHKDRSTGLLVFGILTILLGCMTGMLVLLMLVGQAAARSTAAAATPISALLPAMFIYGVLAVALIWLGIGSIKARRWARALLLIFSWSWLIMGVFAVLGVALFLPKILENTRAAAPPGQPEMPAAAIGIIMVITCLMLGVFFIAVPVVWIFFLQESAREGHVRNARHRGALDRRVSVAGAGSLPVAVVFRADDAGDAHHGPRRDAVLRNASHGPAGHVVLSLPRRVLGILRMAPV
jgi:hypothetical protein